MDVGGAGLGAQVHTGWVLACGGSGAHGTGGAFLQFDKLGTDKRYGFMHDPPVLGRTG